MKVKKTSGNIDNIPLDHLLAFYNGATIFFIH